MSYISVDFDESYRCADIIESLGSQLHETVTGAQEAQQEKPELIHTLDIYSRKLRELAADLYNATRDYEIDDARSFGKDFKEYVMQCIPVDAVDIKALLTQLSLKLDQCAEDVPGEITVRNNLYFRMKDAAKEARMLMKEMD